MSPTQMPGSHRMRVHGRASCIAILGVLLIAGAVMAMPQASSPAPTLLAAVLSLQSGDVAGAVRVLEQLSRLPGADGRTWRTLGTAYQQLHQYSRAVAAYQRALKLEPDSPQVFYSLGSAYAAIGDSSRALAWLRRARASRRYDMTQIDVDPNLHALKTDPRVRALLPSQVDFEFPFVEPVKIIREWRGEAPNDQFGWIARNIGDVDGDGINDIVTSAPTHGPGNSHAGRIYVYSTGTGRLLWSADGSPGDELGTGVEAAGDTNHDGIPDVVASGPAGKGIARIYSGRDGQVLHEFHAPDTTESFGTHVSGAGDVDGDGCTDIIVGSPGRDGEAKSAGHAYVYSGKTGKLLVALEGERKGDQFGSTVAGYADGRQQYLIVGAPGAGAAHHGRVYVYAGASHALKFVIDADDTGVALGAMFVSFPGDMDGDGVSEIYAADWSNAARGVSTGRVYVYSGRTGQRLLTLTGETAGEGFGTSPAVAGDVDGDGRADLIVGAWQYGAAAVSGGRAYLYSGSDGRLLKTFTDRIPGDTLGFDAVGLGNFAGDGTSELLITAAWSGVHGYHSGRVFVVASGVARAALRR